MFNCFTSNTTSRVMLHRINVQFKYLTICTALSQTPPNKKWIKLWHTMLYKPNNTNTFVPTMFGIILQIIMDHVLITLIMCDTIFNNLYFSLSPAEHWIKVESFNKCFLGHTQNEKFVFCLLFLRMHLTLYTFIRYSANVDNTERYRFHQHGKVNATIQKLNILRFNNIVLILLVWICITYCQ